MGVILLAVPAQAAPGDLDPSFGIGGKVTTDFGPGSNSARAIAIQADGKIVAVGASGAGAFALARYNTDGSLDASFGTGGKVTTSIGIFDVAFAVALQADGKIVAAGGTAPEGFCCQFALARYNTDGTLDTSFGTGGKVTTIFGGNSQAFAVAIHTDGKIVAAGNTFSPFVDDFALARYNTDGTLDTSFGTGGKVTTDFGGVDAASAVAIQADGKIVAAGTGGPLTDFALARYNTDGTLDTSFGTGGKVTIDFGGFDGANGIAIQSDGKIVTAGSGGFFQRFALARFNTDGSLDTGFGTGGKATTLFSGQNIESASGLAIQENGKIVAAGFAFFNFFPEFALARFNTDGSLDTSFGTGGNVATSFGDRSFDVAQAVAIQSDGKIVVAGGAGSCVPPCEFALARYLGDPVTLPFAMFSAKVDINVASSSFEINSSFTLGSGGSINPLTQDVTSQLGGFTTKIPAGSFQQQKKGDFVFEGIINGVPLEVKISPLSGGSYSFKIEGAGAPNLPTANPVTVSLTIGNNTGSISVNADFE